MNGKLLWFAMLMFLSSVFAGERLPVDDTLYSNAILVSRGRRLMSSQRLQSGAVGQRLSGWQFPDSILFHGDVYRVNSTSSNGRFVIERGTTNENRWVAAGRVHFLGDEYKARICASGVQAMNNVTFPDVGDDIVLSLVGGATNVWHMADVEGGGMGQDVLLFKNMFVSFYGSSNKVELVKLLLNAGLQETERLSLP